MPTIGELCSHQMNKEVLWYFREPTPAGGRHGLITSGHQPDVQCADTRDNSIGGVFPCLLALSAWLMARGGLCPVMAAPLGPGHPLVFISYTLRLTSDLVQSRYGHPARLATHSYTTPTKRTRAPKVGTPRRDTHAKAGARGCPEGAVPRAS